MIELGENVCAENICEARVEVETTLNSPFDPTYPYPCPEPIDSCVVEAEVNDPYVVDEKLNLFTPEKKLESDSSVVDADEPPAVRHVPFTA
jgi:hypothetical protein